MNIVDAKSHQEFRNIVFERFYQNQKNRQQKKQLLAINNQLKFNDQNNPYLGAKARAQTLLDEFRQIIQKSQKQPYTLNYQEAEGEEP